MKTDIEKALRKLLAVVKKPHYEWDTLDHEALRKAIALADDALYKLRIERKNENRP